MVIKLWGDTIFFFNTHVINDEQFRLIDLGKKFLHKLDKRISN